MKKHLVRSFCVVLVLSLFASLIGCGKDGAAESTPPSNSPAESAAPSAPEEVKLPSTPQIIGTHNNNSLFYLIGSGIAATTSSHTPLRSVVQPYSGPSAWMPDLDSGAIQFGIINYTEAPRPARTRRRSTSLSPCTFCPLAI